MSVKIKTSDHPAATLLVQALADSGLKHAVISPGSRNAPLTIAFDAHPLITTHVIVDERSAAHFALGLALRDGVPAAVICTSGTAALNHGSAVAEAYHHGIPLISITADRPLSARGRGHGQSVYQKDVFGLNCGISIEVDELQLSEEDIYNVGRNVFAETITKSMPTHINVPFEEPLYGLAEYEMSDEEFVPVEITQESDLEEFEEISRKFKRPMLLGGSLPFFIRNEFTTNLPGVCENFSGANGNAIVKSGDMMMRILGGSFTEEIIPDVVITFGTPTLSKAIRNEIIKLDIPHYHIEYDGNEWDTFNTLIDSIHGTPRDLGGFDLDEGYVQAWEKLKSQVESYDAVAWSDLKAFEILLGSEYLKNSAVHLSNSTSARYAQIVQLARGVRLHSNRGVAGIDGCTSTALGDAVAADENELVFLISGDIAFRYDLNGLALAEKLPKNLRVIVINNGGGEIFRWLKGPQETGLVEKYFETKPTTTVKAAAEYCGLTYFCGVDIESAIEGIEKLSKHDGPAILELVTDPEMSESVYKNLLAKNNERTQLDND